MSGSHQNHYNTKTRDSCLKELYRKLKEIERNNPVPVFPYPKLKLRANYCNCKNAKLNTLRVGEPLPKEYIDQETGEVFYPSSRLTNVQQKKGCY